MATSYAPKMGLAKVSPRAQEKISVNAGVPSAGGRRPDRGEGVNSAPPKVADVSNCTPMGNKPQQKVSVNASTRG